MAKVEGDPAGYEQQHVHNVYNDIASHFSATRYKPWPIIEQFLSSLPVGSIGLDSGTGNGKYLPLPLDRPTDIFTFGLDRSPQLLRIAQRAGNRQREVLLGDALQSCWRPEIFDYAMSIATIHHLSTPERRRKAIKLIRSVSPSGGRILIYVWAVDQDENSKRTIPVHCSQNSALNGLDAFVPWVMSPTRVTSIEHVPPPRVFNRFYHFFASGELNNLTCDAAKSLGLAIGPPCTGGALRGLEIVRDGYEKSNWFIELRLWSTILI